MPFMKFNIPSSVFSPGKRPKHVLGQMLDVWCLMFIPFCYIQQVLCHYILHNTWAFLSMMVPLILSGEGGTYVCFALFSPFLKALKRGVPCSEDGGVWQRNPPWAFCEPSAQCKYWAEYLSKAVSAGNSVTDLQNFVLHLLANTLTSPPFGKKSTYVLVGKNDKGKPFSLYSEHGKETRTCEKYFGNIWMSGVWVYIN